MHLCAQMISFPLCLMVHPIFENVTSQPALQRFTTDNNECAARFGRMCACRARRGSWSRSSVHVCVVLIFSPFGSFARMGETASSLLVYGADVMRKWLLAPESIMAHSCTLAELMVTVCMREEVGVEVIRVLLTLMLCSLLLSLHVVLAPNRQYCGCPYCCCCCP